MKKKPTPVSTVEKGLFAEWICAFCGHTVNVGFIFF